MCQIKSMYSIGVSTGHYTCTYHSMSRGNIWVNKNPMHHISIATSDLTTNLKFDKHMLLKIDTYTHNLTNYHTSLVTNVYNEVNNVNHLTL